jgi:hypothetical protein
LICKGFHAPAVEGLTAFIEVVEAYSNVEGLLAAVIGRLNIFKIIF